MAFRRRSSAAPRKRRRRIRKLRLLALLTVLGFLCTAAFAFGLVKAISGQIPELDPARQQRIEVDGTVLAGDGHTVLAVLRGAESRVLVDSGEIAPLMKHAIVAIEDQRFYEHRGIDLRGIVRALWADVRSSRTVQGGSTITQQFIKNTYVKNERSIARKLKEAALAWQLEQDWSKERILTAYLNTIYFGNGAYGVQQAAQTYFGKGASRLELHEAALLAGIPADPTLYDPVTNPRTARKRRTQVLQAMLDQRLIDYNQYRTANRAPLPSPESVGLPGTEGPAQYFVNYIKQQLTDRYGSACVFGGGLRVETTIDLHLQELARDAIGRYLGSSAGPAAALVALDPRDGRVLAMVGGNNFRKSQFNLAVQGERQAGSSFKPIVLAAALQQGIAPSTTFVSKPITISLGDRLWPVHNYENAYLGAIDLAKATEESDNAVYAQLTAIVQPRNVVATARRLGITRQLRHYYAIGLGAEAASPLEMARVFATLANGGRRIDGSALGDQPRAIESVEARTRCKPFVNRPAPKPAVSPLTAGLVTSMLQRVVTSGTGRRAALPDRPVAGKTGTTENYGDAWFVGYTPQLAVAVWVGYADELRPMLTEYHGRPVAGGTYPAEIWRAFMTPALRYLKAPPKPFARTDVPYASAKRIVLRRGRLWLDNGVCRSSIVVSFFTGFGPTEPADCKQNEVEVPRVVGQRLATARKRLEAQPLTAAYVYKPAKPGQRLGIVLGQIPDDGTLSSFDEVQLVLAKPLHGVVPRVIGLDAERARARLARLKLAVRFAGPRTGRIVAQTPPAGVAAAPGMAVTLVAEGDSRSATLQARSATAARPPG